MPSQWDAHYHDGRSPARHNVTVTVTRTGLEIAGRDGAARHWPYAEIRQTQGFYAGEPVRLERGDEITEALVVGDVELLARLREMAPEVKGFHDPRQRGRRARLTVLAALAAIGLAGLAYAWGIPAWARITTMLVPVEWEERLGEAVFARLVAPEAHCKDPKRQRAIDGILATLTATRPGLPYRLRVAVADSPAVNAFALPGGRIVIFRGLLEFADSPEMLAGILAHEVQHVVQRHTTRALLEYASTSLMVAAISGDVTGIVAFGLEGARLMGSLRYRRQHEDEADREGMRMLLDAGVDPAGMIAFFDRRGADTERKREGLTRYLSTHPTHVSRAATLRDLAARASRPPVKLLPDHDWKDVKRMCGTL